MPKAQRTRKPSRSRVAIPLIAVTIVFLAKQFMPVQPAEGAAASGGESALGSNPVAELFREQRSEEMVTFAGTVERSLSDDLDGSRHQRFIVRLADDLTVLVAHNIDLAPRVPLDEGDAVEVRGQYEYNDKGGVVHWTHHDPQKRHAEGWIRHAGQLYE